MTTILPTQTTYGRVTGKFLKAVADSADADTLPDSAPVSGTVTFTPSPAAILVASSTPPVTILPQPIVVTLDANGAITDGAGAAGIQLVATDDPAFNPTGWTYAVSFNFAGVKYATFNISVPGGATVDLATLAPVPSASGTPTAVGPQGPFGVVLCNYGAVAGTARPTVVLNGFVTPVPLVYWVGNVGVNPTNALATDLIYQS